jgi:Fic family protein
VASNKALQILSDDLLADYLVAFPTDVSAVFESLTEAEISTDNFSFYTSVASVYSSKIEGEEVELDSYIKHKKFGIQFQPDYTKKVDDLYDAYNYAKTHSLNAENIATAHQLLSKNLLLPHQQGVFRNENMFVTTPDGRIEYVACLPQQVSSEMQKLYNDLTQLLSSSLSFEEALYYAAYIHLVFVKIHPWSDGNGRTARLLEKWFLAEKLGEKAWFVQSEKHYYQQHNNYYKNLRNLGLEYERLKYQNALPFLLMLPDSISED